MLPSEPASKQQQEWKWEMELEWARRQVENYWPPCGAYDVCDVSFLCVRCSIEGDQGVQNLSLQPNLHSEFKELVLVAEQS